MVLKIYLTLLSLKLLTNEMGMVATFAPGLNWIKDINRKGKQALPEAQAQPLRAGPRPSHTGSPPIAPASTHPLPLDGISQQLDHIVAFHTTAPKTFGPGNKGALGAEKLGHSSNSLHGVTTLPPTVPMPTLPHPVQARLVTREGEAEPKLQTLFVHGECIQELRQTVGSKVKELWDKLGAQLCPPEPQPPSQFPETGQ